MTTSTLETIVTEAVRGVHSYVPKEESTDLVGIINIKDLVDGSIDISSQEMREISAAQRKEENKVHEGDVLVTIRGTQFRAAVAPHLADDNFASSNLAILRVDRSKVRPEILTAYLNSPLGQGQLTSRARGVSISSIAMKDLLSITVPQFPLDKQDLMKDYLMATADYLSTLRREVEQIGQIRENLMIQFFGVPS